MSCSLVGEYTSATVSFVVRDLTASESLWHFDDRNRGASVRRHRPTSASYWAYGFPSAIVSVFGADFVFPSGTLFVAKVSLTRMNRVSQEELFQTLTQVFLPNLVSALITQRRSPAWDCYGLAVTTIVHDATLRLEAPNESTELYSKPALHAYKAAQWGAFAIAITGTQHVVCSEFILKYHYIYKGPSWPRHSFVELVPWGTVKTSTNNRVVFRRISNPYSGFQLVFRRRQEQLCARSVFRNHPLQE